MATRGLIFNENAGGGYRAFVIDKRGCYRPRRVRASRTGALDSWTSPSNGRYISSVTRTAPETAREQYQRDHNGSVRRREKAKTNKRNRKPEDQQTEQQHRHRRPVLLEHQPPRLREAERESDGFGLERTLLIAFRFELLDIIEHDFSFRRRRNLRTARTILRPDSIEGLLYRGATRCVRSPWLAHNAKARGQADDPGGYVQ